MTYTEIFWRDQFQPKIWERRVGKGWMGCDAPLWVQDNATPKMQISMLEEHNGSTKSDHKLISKMKQSNSFSAFPLGFVLRGYCLKVKSSTCTFT